MHKLINKNMARKNENQGNKQINKEILGSFSAFITEYTILE